MRAALAFNGLNKKKILIVCKYLSVSNPINILAHSSSIIPNILFRGELVKKFYFEEPVYGIDVSPESPNLFATASEDGTVQICDVRSTDGG